MATETKHALRLNGAPFTDEAQLVNPENPKTTSGYGRALCACGELSPDFSSGAARRDWFKGHKLVEVLPVAETPAAEPVEPEPATAPEPAAEPAEDLLGAPAEEDYSKSITFTDQIAAMFFRHFGREGTKTFIAANYPTVTATPKTNGLRIILTGPKDDVKAATAGLKEMWAAAAVALKEWTKTDPEFLARPTKGLEGRTASFTLKSRFLVNFAAEFEPTA